MRKPPKIHATRTVARSRIFHIQALDLEFSNGTQVTFERMKGSGRGAVIVAPITADGEVLLIREYAAGTEQYELGLPKGLVDPGETLLEAANREIQEEAGVGAGQLEHIHTVSLAPGYLDHRTHVILATDLYPSRLPGDEPEELEVVPWPLSDLEGLLARDDFSEARAMATLFLIREKLQR